MLISEQIRAARALLGWSARELADRTGLHSTTVQRMEAGSGLVNGNIRSIRRIQEALEAAGITDYSWERAWNDYRRGVYAGFAVTVIASMMVQQTERGDEMFTAMARRHARHAVDLGAEEFLAG